VGVYVFQCVCYFLAVFFYVEAGNSMFLDTALNNDIHLNPVLWGNLRSSTQNRQKSTLKLKTIKVFNFTSPNRKYITIVVSILPSSIKNCDAVPELIAYLSRSL